MGHLKVGLVLFSIKDLAAPETALYTMQGMGGGTFALPKNACFAGNGGPLGTLGTPTECAFELKTHAGAQAIYVMVLDYDTNGSITDRTDDTVKLVGFGMLRGLSPNAGDTLDSLVIPLGADAVTNVRTSGGTTPIAGLASEQVIPLLNLGDPEGVAPIFIPPQLAKTASPRDPDVPPLAGALAGLSYDFLLTATPSATMAGPPSAMTAVRGFKLTGTPTLPEYLPLPTSINGGGTVSFVASAGAVSYVGSLRGDGAMSDAWQLVMLDPKRVAYSLPDPSVVNGVGSQVPVGKVNVTVVAADTPAWNPREFKSQDAAKTATRLSSNLGSYTH
jgi:hypothetical protein